MSRDEFVYWLSGYVSAIEERVKVPNETDWSRIKEALRKVYPVHTQGLKFELAPSNQL